MLFRWVLLCAILSTVLFGTLFCTGARAQGVAAFGDSLTLGLEVEEPFPEQLGWQNLGMGGSTTRHWYAAWAFFSGAWDRKDRVHILLGTNDAGEDLGALLYRQRLEFLVAKALFEGAPRVLVSTPPYSACGWPEYDALIDAYHAEIVALVAFSPKVDSGADLRPMPAALFVDCVHPNQDGHDWIAEQLAP